jgi:hypothetical protein
MDAQAKMDIQRVSLRADRRGYVLDEESVDGFLDRPDLPIPARKQIARWASRFSPETLSRAQVKLLSEEDDRNFELLAGALEDAENDIPEGVRNGYYEGLSFEELEYMRIPESHPDLTSGYPLTLRQLGLLTDTNLQTLKEWINLELIPSRQIDQGRYFLSAGVARVFSLKYSRH